MTNQRIVSSDASMALLPANLVHPLRSQTCGLDNRHTRAHSVNYATRRCNNVTLLLSTTCVGESR